MRVVGFDTATDDTVVAATDGGELAFEQVLPPGDRRPVHSSALLELIEEAARELGGWSEVERIAVGIGPGTFTGIRIGVSTAAGLGVTTGVDVAGVPTLAALARSIGRQTGSELVVPLIDARRGEVFGGVFDAEGEELGESFACGPETLIERLNELASEGRSPVVAGSGAVRFRDELVLAGLEVAPAGSPVHRLTGRPFCDLGATTGQTGPDSLKPLYLRVPDAQLWLERDRSSND